MLEYDTPILIWFHFGSEGIPRESQLKMRLPVWDEGSNSPPVWDEGGKQPSGLGWPIKPANTAI